MSKGNWKFRPSDLTRALKAARAADLPVQRIHIDRDGRISIMIGQPVKPVGPASTDDLDRELAEFEASHGQG